MKKTIFIICILLAVFSFSTETYAIKNEPTRNAINSFTVPTRFLYNEKSLDFKPTVSKRISIEPQEAALPVSKLTVVDSKQVTVKYELWIVKMLKKLLR